MMTYRKWDIVLVPFPFTDQKTTKKRPALVISPNDYNRYGDVIIVFVTSNLRADPKPGDYLIKTWQKARLPKPSMIRMKFATVFQSMITRKLGRLSNEDQEGFRSLLVEFLSSG